MRIRTTHRASALALLFLLGLSLLSVATPFFGPVTAQDPPPIPPLPAPDTDNATRPPQDDLIQIGVFPERLSGFLGENDGIVIPVTVRDMSQQALTVYRPGIDVKCTYTTPPDVEGWVFTIGPPSVTLSRGTEARMTMNLGTSTKFKPADFWAEVVCKAPQLDDRIVGNFTVRGFGKPYYYSAITVTEYLPPLSPNEEFQVTISVQNAGNQLALYRGEILQPPPGWSFGTPPDVAIPAGETRLVNITGIAPRDQLLYLFHSEGVRINYYPIEAPGRGQVVFVPLTVDGIYLHPALIPLTLLGLLLVGVFIFMVVFAKRQIEEQILGKPVPPWRIPIEREYLGRLEKEDPDEFYVVRHYLMEEEHASALLWYHHFKKATKNDRHAEARWVKVKRKQERKVAALEKDHQKLERKWARKIRFLEWRRGRKAKKVERKLAVLNAGLQAKLDKKHGAEVAKIKKRFKKDRKKLKKRQKKAEKKVLRTYDRDVHKAERAIFRENKARAKRGEDLLPPPDVPQPEMPRLTVEEPVYPERPIASVLLLSETKLQKRMDRVQARFDRKRARKEARRDRILAKDRAKIDGKTQRLMAKVPAEPKTHLYEADDYLAEDEVIVEDDRSPFARWLNLPTLEEQEMARRRRGLHAAERLRLKQTGDRAALEGLDAGWKAERARARDERKGRARSTHAAQREEEALARQRQKEAKRRAKELTEEAKVEAKALRADRAAGKTPRRPAGPPAPEGPERIPVKALAPEGSAAPSQEEGSRLRLRFGRGKGKEKGQEEKAKTVRTTGESKQE